MKSFIVHGSNSALKLELKDYLQNTLKFSEPVILDQKASKGMTIIEKFEHYASDCEIAFSLFTPDDFAANEQMRARQNVIFEYGYFLGKFGRKSGRVFLLYKENLELPSDLKGVIYINVSSGIESAGEIIRTELEAIEDEVQSSSNSDNDGYKLRKTEGGDHVLQSQSLPEVFICQNCHSEDKIKILPSPGELSGISVCHSCKSRYKMKPKNDSPSRVRKSSSWVNRY